MGYMLETRGLTKRFGRGDQAQDAVADVSLHIREGEVYGLLGPNGAGKSTTLKMICGMLRPTAGEILFAGHAWRREDLYAIGSLIEEAPLYPNLTARENLRVRTTLLGLPESRVDEVLAAVDLADTGKKRAGRFSMGMRQRLGLALALIARPRLLVLDEPTNGLDPIGIEELRDQIRGFAAAGTTVIVSSHILSEVQQMADTIGIIYGGRLAYEDALRPGQDLEELFMSVCREGRRARGEKWMPMVPYFQVISLAGMFAPIATVSNNVLKVKSNGRIIVRLEVVKKIVMTLVLILTIPHSVLAVTWGLSAMAFFEMILNFGATTRYAGLTAGRFLRTLLPIASATAAMFGVVWAFGHFTSFAPLPTFLLKVAVGVVCYAGFGALFRLEAMRIAWELVKKLFR